MVIVIIGDPYKFSIIIQAIPEWNIAGSSFANGVLLFCIDGDLYPKRVRTATLNFEISELKGRLSHLSVNAELFELEKEKAFSKLYNITFPEWCPGMVNCGDINNDYCYFLSPSVLSDCGCHVYGIRNDTQLRIIAAKLNYNISESAYSLGNLHISETFISTDDVNEIIGQLEKWES